MAVSAAVGIGRWFRCWSVVGGSRFCAAYDVVGGMQIGKFASRLDDKKLPRDGRRFPMAHTPKTIARPGAVPRCGRVGGSPALNSCFPPI